MKSSGISSVPPKQTSTDPAPSRSRFALTGRSRAFDPHTTAARADLADVRLADQIFAPHYAAPLVRTTVTAATLLARRDGDPLVELDAGEPFEVLELTSDQAWGVLPRTGAVGYLPLSALATE